MTTTNLALYRRYRPETFQEVVGQDHVTGPLTAALRKDRVSHAYLFSGPRGCGKTTSARILARCLNCVQGPIDTPCGQCPSCVELSRSGSGSLDVVEIDAASHGGVDDARELRERATFAPVRDRYKVFIIDEAHMVTSAGFNALLKIVEEPPEHIKFIFATTEPEKVIGTIRSRTHHYPFRLVPPDILTAYLEDVCRREGIEYQKAALSLVIRAGGGSVRDTLSVLDQLMAGVEGGCVSYDLAVALLGFTPAALLDDMVTGITDADGAMVFGVVDKIIQSGQDPRRFVEDLLERFRDLIVVSAAADHAAAILRRMPPEELDAVRKQARRLRPAELSRYADVTNKALKEMTGATSPRVHLELLAARLLLPASDHTEQGLGARLDKLERLVTAAQHHLPPAGSGSSAPTPHQGPAARSGEKPSSKASETPDDLDGKKTAAPAQRLTSVNPMNLLGQLPEGIDPWENPTGKTLPQYSKTPQHSGQQPKDPGAEARKPGPSRDGSVPQDNPAAGGEEKAPTAPQDFISQDFTTQWQQVTAVLEKIRRSTARLLDGAQAEMQEGGIVLRFNTEGLRRTFEGGGNDVYVKQAVAQVFGSALPITALTGNDASAVTAADGGIRGVKPENTRDIAERPADGAVSNDREEGLGKEREGRTAEKTEETPYTDVVSGTVPEEELSDADKAWLDAEPLEPEAEKGKGTDEVKDTGTDLDALTAALTAPVPLSENAPGLRGDPAVRNGVGSPAARQQQDRNAAPGNSAGEATAGSPGVTGVDPGISQAAGGEQLYGKAAIEKVLGGTVIEERIVENMGEA